MVFHRQINKYLHSKKNLQNISLKPNKYFVARNVHSVLFFSFMCHRAKALRIALKRRNTLLCLQPCDPRAKLPYPAVKLGSSIGLGRQIVHRVVVKMSGIQKAPNVINLIPESYVNVVQRKGHHWRVTQKEGRLDSSVVVMSSN